MSGTPEIQGKIVFFGPPGAGATENVRYIHRKLRKEHRGDIQVAGGGSYEFLPIQLNKIRDIDTTIHVYTMPGGPEHRDARRRLLARVDGIVFVADLRTERHQANVDAIAELKSHLASYDRSLDDVILVVQYNQRDGADENALDHLHRRLGVKPSAYFEAVACNGTGVLQTLTTISKLMLARLRERLDSGDSCNLGAPDLGDVAEVEAELTGTFGDSPVAEVVDLADDKGFRLESAGPVSGQGGTLRIPIRIVEEEADRQIELCLTLSFDGS